MSNPPFGRSVFVNCPFDDEFAYLLQAIAFCICDLGFIPRLAPENPDNSAARLARIKVIISTSKYAIHDLSRGKSAKANEFGRFNMPFELGLDHACREFGSRQAKDKKLLILENERYDTQKCLSDVSGWDVRAHENDHLLAVRHVRDWLVRQAGASRKSPSKILTNYATFQEWFWEKELDEGASEDDIQSYPTVELIDLMLEWISLGRPF